MLENHQQEALFTLLRQALKAKGYTYADLATALGVGELSIKRLFRDKDCKMSRLLEICDFLQIRLDDLLTMQSRVVKTPEFLPEATEAALGEDLNLFTLFILLFSQASFDDIQSLTDFDEAEFYLHLRQLEELGLIELLTEKRFRFAVDLPIRWRLNGPLAAAIKRTNILFLSHCFDNEANPDYQFLSASRLMTKASIDELQQQLKAIRQRFDYLATQDQMFYPADQLKFYKIVLNLGEFPVQDIFAK